MVKSIRVVGNGERSLSRGFRPLPTQLRVYLILLWLLSALSLLASLFFRAVLHRSQYPYGRILLPPVYNNADFTCFRDRFPFFHQAAFFGPHIQPFNYPAPVALLYEIFYGLSRQPVQRFVQFSGVCYLAATAVFAIALIKRRLSPSTAIAFSASCLVLSYPILFAFYLSNMEFAVWLSLAGGVWAYAQGRSWSASACFGFAASLKIYPLIFLGLAIARRQYKQAVFGLVVCVFSLVTSLWILGPTIRLAYLGLAEGVGQFKVDYIFHFRPFESGFDHSLFGLVKRVLAFSGHTDLLPKIAGPYLVVVAILGLVLYIARIRHLPAINQVLALTVASILLPPVSHDYTLIHLYAPWAMFVLFLIDDDLHRNVKGTAATLLCFAILFTPQNYLIHHGLLMAGQVKSVTLIVLFILALRFPFVWRSVERDSESHLYDEAVAI